ncbi:DUF1176 domain-containing protein [Buttiauxella ferragutiae]|uniref:DUF1176 domain-containing protein n=1 Tax=Buttiauxella ferragutiae TaxID=82989 RepID=UPI001F537247|nr:DUF1176 domain-containing protein [Buttiauxella ferragutiae]UNK61034.1 DUF1176 domain-containing protein [Buttiauxella ferragutiae]
MRHLIWLACAGLFSTQLFAAPLTGLSFEHKDWQVSCDNTGTCRAAGYSRDLVSVLLTRVAGRETSAKVEVTFAQPTASSATLFIDGEQKGELTPLSDGSFSIQFTARDAFLTALSQDNTIEFESGGKRIPLSSAGSNAVLLKMDEFQKTTNTSNAMLHPGNENTDNVLLAKPAPLIISQPVIPAPDAVPLTTTQLQKIAPQLKLTPEMQCREIADEQTRTYYRIPVDKNHALIKTECFDSSRFALWLTDNTLTARPELITHDASKYENGEIARLSGPIQIWVWNGKQFLLRDQYRSSGHNGAWTLPTFVSRVRTQHDVDTDNAALQKLYQAVTDLKKTDPELTLTKLANQFTLTGEVTKFELSTVEDATPSKTKPSAEISDDEWQAFLRSPVMVESEDGSISFTLLDMDGDGKRDLIINSYVGGTGLYSYTGVLKRGENSFYNPRADRSSHDGFGPFFSENGRGANQWSEWVRINGQVYALWFNGQFGEDNLYLLRPFSVDDKTPAITIRYRYTLDTISSSEENQPKTPALSDKDKARLLKSLDTMQDHLLKDMAADQKVPPICPIPPGTSAKEAESYHRGVPLHYAFESVAYIPVWLNEKCYIGTVASHHGSYNKGVGAEIAISSPREGEESVNGYYISGLRHVTSVKSGWKARAGDNGVL